MEGKELIKRLVVSYPVIYGGAMMATWLCCMVYAPDSVFGLDYFGRMFLVALAGDLPSLIFFSRKELTEKQWMLRTAVHLAVLVAVLLIIGYFMDFYHGFGEGAVFAASVFLVYAAVKVLCFTGDFVEARRMNERLKRMKG